MIHKTEDRIVTIFGGSKCREDSVEYKEARELGRLLAEAGFTICTGGYLGVMEAASELVSIREDTMQSRTESKSSSAI